MTDAQQNSEPKPARAMELLKRTKGRLVSQGMVDPNVAAQIDVVGEPVIPAVLESKPVVQEVTQPGEEVSYDIGEVPADTAPKKVIPKELVPDDLTDDADSVINPKGSTAENFSNLRKKLKSEMTERKELKARLETIESEREEARQKLEEYQSGAAVPEVVDSLKQRIAELEPLEAVMHVERTPAYKHEITDAMTREQESLFAHAEENGVSQEDIQRAYGLTPGPEQNRFLQRIFGDDLGALEAKKILGNIKGIQVKAQGYKQNAGESLASLQADSVRIESERKRKQYDNAIVVSQDAWKDSLQSIREDERFPDLAFREGDSEHNNRTKTMLNKASSQFGMMVADIAQNGLTKNTAVALARSNKLAIYSAVKAAENEELKKEVARLKKIVNEDNYMNSPGVSPGVSTNSPLPRKYENRYGAGSPEKAGRNLLNRVQGK